MYLVIVGSVIAFALYYWLVRNMDVTNTMLIALVTPVVAVILGMIGPARATQLASGRRQRLHHSQAWG